jgi:hypothetical protein
MLLAIFNYMPGGPAISRFKHTSLHNFTILTF